MGDSSTPLTTTLSVPIISGPTTNDDATDFVAQFGSQDKNFKGATSHPQYDAYHFNVFGLIIIL